MSRILLVWQLGGNLGHIVRLRTLARALRNRGHEVIFAFDDRRGAGELIAEGFPVLQAPVLHCTGPDLPRDPISYPEVLFHCGFADADALIAAVRAWRALYRMLAPDLMVFDHAPVALLAARDIGIPRVAIGTGFTVPPRVAPMPTIRPWEEVSRTRLEQSEQRALDTANTALASVRSRPLRFFYELLDTEENILQTLPELDHYGAREDTRYWGPAVEDEGELPRWPGNHGPKVFVYVRRNSPQFAPLVTSLSKSPYRTLWFAPGLAGDEGRRLQTPSMRFTCTPQSLAAVADTTDVAVVSGGHGTAAAMFLGGVPMMLLPQNIEQLLLSRRIEAAGGGHIVSPDLPVPRPQVHIKRPNGRSRHACKPTDWHLVIDCIGQLLRHTRVAQTAPASSFMHTF